MDPVTQSSPPQPQLPKFSICGLFILIIISDKSDFTDTDDLPLPAHNSMPDNWMDVDSEHSDNSDEHEDCEDSDSESDHSEIHAWIEDGDGDVPKTEQDLYKMWFTDEEQDLRAVRMFLHYPYHSTCSF